MIKIRQLTDRIFPVIEILLCLIWLCNLVQTDAYFSIYVLLAFVSLYFRLKKIPVSAGGGLACGVLSVAFSALVILANYPIFTTIGDPALIGRSTSILMNLIDGSLTFLGGYFIAYPLIGWFLNYFPMEIVPDSAFQRRKWMPWFIFLFLSGIHLVHLFLVEFPGNLTEDTFTQISEMVSGTYSNFNTFWHTRLFQMVLTAGYGLFSDINAAAACFTVFQVLILCFAFTYCLSTMAKLGVPKVFLLLTFLLYAIVPYHLALSISIWKDVLFAAGFLLILCAILRIIKDLDSNILMDTFVFLIGSLLFLLSRTSGWVIYLVTFVLALFFCRRRKAFLMLMGTLALAGWFLASPAISLLGVAKGDVVESLSVPIQQVSRVIADGCPLTEEETALLSRVVDVDEVPQLYTDWLSDPMKVEVRSKDADYFRDNLPAYRDLWIRLGLKYPWEYVKAWVDQTKGYWNAGYSYRMYSETVTDNPYGVEKTVSGNPVASLFRLYFGLSRHLIFFEPLHSIGLHVWITILCFILNLRKRQTEWLLFIPLLMLVAGLWFGTPVYCCFRYVYPLFVCFPLLLAVTIYKKP